MVPGPFTSGTSHFAHASTPADTGRAGEYQQPYGDLMTGLGALVPPEADVIEVARAIVRLVAMPAGQRPLRTHVDPSRDGSDVVSAVADRVRAEFLYRLQLDDLLTLWHADSRPKRWGCGGRDSLPGYHIST